MDLTWDEIWIFGPLHRAQTFVGKTEGNPFGF
jgi:hypothetical protein